MFYEVNDSGRLVWKDSSTGVTILSTKRIQEMVDELFPILMTIFNIGGLRLIGAT